MSFNGIYLYSHDSYFKPSQYHYDLHCLAVGLEQIGVPVFSNIQDLDAQFLDINSIQDDLLYVFQITQTSNSYDYLEMIINCPVKNKFILSISDDNAKLIAPMGIPAFLAHGNRFYRVCGGPRIPWLLAYQILSWLKRNL